MKILGHRLLADPAEAIAFVAGLLQVDTLCLGMRPLEELESNARAVMGEGEKQSKGGGDWNWMNMRRKKRSSS